MNVLPLPLSPSPYPVWTQVKMVHHEHNNYPLDTRNECPNYRIHHCALVVLESVPWLYPTLPHGPSTAIQHEYHMSFYLSVKIIIIPGHILFNNQHCMCYINHTYIIKYNTQIYTGYSVYGVSALDTSVLLQGRPHGGCLVIYPDGLGGGAKYIKTVYKRLCALSIIFNDISIYFFCVYMPCDNSDVNCITDDENVLSEISSLCLHHNAEHICIVGDMNTDISRSHSRHTRLLLQFVENEQLYLALNFSNKNVKYTYYNNYHHMHSIIDHFILSQCLFDLIISYHSICEDVDNMSDHSPLCLCLNIDSRKFECNVLKFKPRKKWSSITPDHINTYQYNLDEFIYNIALPYDCINCTNLIQILHDQIIWSLLRSSEVIPETGTK